MIKSECHSDKKSVRMLVEMIQQYGVVCAVVCPGSRNSPIVGEMMRHVPTCVPVTDERCAGYYALGIAAATRRPVAVCVTSGTAMLNLAPALAEARYRHLPVVAVTADRPAAQIGQLLPQTMEQPGAYGGFVKKCVNLPEDEDPESLTLCNRLLNEALDLALCIPAGPVHINVPLAEPLFGTVDEPPYSVPPVFYKKTMSDPEKDLDHTDNSLAWEKLLNAQRPMIVVGQIQQLANVDLKIFEEIARYIAVYAEPLSMYIDEAIDDDTIAGTADDVSRSDYAPDFVLQIGDAIVGKEIHRLLALNPDLEVWAISSDGKPHDTFGRLSKTLKTTISHFLEAAPLDRLSAMGHVNYAQRWALFKAMSVRERAEKYLPFGEEYVVRSFEKSPYTKLGIVHYANSLAVRLGCRYARHHIMVNRGINGIEGSLSTAAGHSITTGEPVYCVTGDLSFFYDSNALWCPVLRGNLRILLLNNHGGAIFRHVQGMPQTDSWRFFVAGEHTANARGICEAYDARYLHANDPCSYDLALQTFLTARHLRPTVLEVEF